MGRKMATKTYRRKPDALTQRDGYTDPIAEGIHHSIKPLDRIATEMELKWGCDRLPGLVSPQMAAKFGSAKAKLDAAVESNVAPDVARTAGVMMRGWAALDAEATKGGHKPLEPHIWSHTTDAGFKFAVAQGNADGIKALKTHPDLEGVAVYSLDEIGRLLESKSMELVNAAKERFPGATVKAVRMPPAGDMVDELPW
tara:strand:+ start:1178 stop:1771 length:594 start_codon:yes stop_codon:yes gene_type:complete